MSRPSCWVHFTLIALAVVVARPSYAQEAQAPPTSIQEIEARIWEELDRPGAASVKFVDEPLSSALQAMEAKHGVEIVMDTRAMTDAGVDREAPVSLSIDNVKLRSALDLMLHPHDLIWTVKNGVLFVTTGEEEEFSGLQTHVYAIGDLLRTDADALIEVIHTIVEPDSWDRVGGAGSQFDVRGTLVVSQTTAAHRQLEGLFAALREALARATAEAPEPTTIRAEPIENLGIYARLGDLCGPIQFVDEPLSSAIQQLENDANLEFVLDRRAMTDAGVDTETPVNLSVGPLPLRNLLNLMVAEHDLTFQVSDEAVVITTTEVTEYRGHKVRVYPIGDLLAKHNGGDDVDSDSIMDTIVTTIEPDGWETVGGAGSIKYYEPGKALVILQTEQVHHQIEQALAGIRAARAKNDANHPDRVGKFSEEDSASTKIKTEIYRIADLKISKDDEFKPEAFAESLMKKIKELSPGGLWSTPGSRLTMLPDRIIVLHNKEGQRKVRDLLDNLGLLVKPAPIPSEHRPYAGGGGFGSSGGGGGAFRVEVR